MTQTDCNQITEQGTIIKSDTKLYVTFNHKSHVIDEFNHTDNFNIKTTNSSLKF